MTANPIYDCIVDEIVRVLETDEVWLPEAFDIYLPNDQVNALMEAGMYQGGKKMAISTPCVTIKVDNIKVTVHRELVEEPVVC